MLLALFLACSGPRSAAELPPADASLSASPADEVVQTEPLQPIDGGVGDATAAPPGVEAAPNGGWDPTALYQGCRDRVEGVETAGECTTDADCSRAGCSQEMCVAAVNAGDVMSTCEVLPCFRVLDTCGCHEGLCTWTLRADPPPMGRLPLPAK